MKYVFPFMLLLFGTYSAAHSQVFDNPFSNKSKIDTLYYPFHEGKQLIVIDQLSQFIDVDYYYSQHMNSLPPGLYQRAIGNEYFIRDSKGKLIQSFNSNVSLDSLAEKLKPTSFINRKRHIINHHQQFFEFQEISSFYRIYNCAIENFNRLDSTFHLKMGMIDTLGTVIVPPQFEYVQEVKNRFLVRENEAFGLMDNKLTVLVPLAYESFNIEDSLIYFYGKHWIESVYNLSSKRFVDLKNDTIREFDYKRGFFEVIKNGKYGLLNASTHQLLIPCEYDDIINYYYSSDWHRSNAAGFSGLVIVQKNKKFGLVTLSDNVVLDCIYDKIFKENDVTPSSFKVEQNGEIKLVKGKIK